VQVPQLSGEAPSAPCWLWSRLIDRDASTQRGIKRGAEPRNLDAAPALCTPAWPLHPQVGSQVTI